MQDRHDLPEPNPARESFRAAIRETPPPSPRTAYRAEPPVGQAVLPLPAQAMENLNADMATMGEAYTEPAIYRGSVGRTMFDSPASEDNTITVLLAKDNIEAMPAQSLVRIVSTDERHRYIGVVTKGPFAEPDGLRADAPVIVTTTVRGGILMPRFHGRVQVELLGEELTNGEVEPPRFRPLPNSPVFVLNASETARIMQTSGDIRLGLAVGHENLPVAFPLKKSVLPRHTGILGTTGGGKSTTVSGLIAQLQQQQVATVLIDTEGEYTEMDQPTEDPRMLARLQQLGRTAEGVQGTSLYHLVGRETSNPKHPNKAPFSLRLSKISPFALSEILGFNDAQDERFTKAYELTKLALERLYIYPRRDNERDRLQAVETDEFERGWPGMNLQHLYDVVSLIALHTDKQPDQWHPRTPQFAADPGMAEVKRLVAGGNLPASVPSWRAVQGRLGQLQRLKVFDSPVANGLEFETLIRPGNVSIVDLSDTESPQINNLVIAELLRGVMDHQDEAYKKSSASGAAPTPVVVIIEEAHEFLSAERIKRMQVLFEQVARIAKRGRKRWLGLVFVTQLPQHLPDEVLGLINNWILHKISDAGVVGHLRRSIGRVDDSLWQRLPSLAPGQAVVAIEGMARPMLVAIDPTACKLRMID